MTELTTHNHECWGPWEDEGPYYVKADGRTIEEAAKILQTHGFEGMIIYSFDKEIRAQKVWDCEYDVNKPCGEPTCRHDHIENVYQLYVAEKDYFEESSDCEVILRPDEADKVTHELKTDPEVFEAVYAGLKTYELRFNDRDYKVGDMLLLKETKYSGYEMKHGNPLEYTGRECEAEITHVLKGPVFGLADGWAILSISLTFISDDETALRIHEELQAAYISYGIEPGTGHIYFANNEEKAKGEAIIRRIEEGQANA